MPRLEAKFYILVGALLDSPVAYSLILAALGKTDKAVYWACVGVPLAFFGSLLIAGGAAELLYNTKKQD